MKPSLTLPLLLFTVLCSAPWFCAQSAAAPAASQPPTPLTPDWQLGRDIFRELVEIDTTATTGDSGRAAEAMAARLLAGGLPAADVHVFRHTLRTGSLVALRGSGTRRPVLFMAHLDVVEAPREGWTFDPFKLTEQDGYFYGRGTSDDKCGAAGLARLAAFEFPARLDETTRGYFERMADRHVGQFALDMRAVARREPDPAAIARLSAHPLYNALLRTTCVATRLEAGHADNALPLTARAMINCRILPGETPDEVRQTIVRVLADDGITVTPAHDAWPSPVSPLNPEVFGALERVTAEIWPGAPVIPTMAVWTTDAMFLRRTGIPAYCVDGFPRDAADVREREHGNDERLRVQSFYDGLEFNHRLVKVLSGSEGE